MLFRSVVVVAKGYLTLFCEEFENPRSWWYKIHNYNGVNGGAAGCLALALRTAHPEEAPSWIDRAVAIVERWMTSGFDEEGAYFEGISYSAYGLSSTLLFADALRRAGSRHDLYRHPLLQQLGAYYALSLLPGESVYDRSEERRVGKECKSRRSTYQYKIAYIIVPQRARV